MDIIRELFTTYWSQVTLLLLVFGYFGKRFFDFVSKKKEINHNLLQERRLNAVNSFFQTYAEVERMWEELTSSLYSIMDKKISPAEMDEMVFSKLDRLKGNVLELQIYFDHKEHKYFKLIHKNSIDINKHILEIYFDQNPKKSANERAGEFYIYKSKKLNENNLFLYEISVLVREAFK